MAYFNYQQNEKTGEKWLETSLTGKLLLNTTLLNKGTAFTNEERGIFELEGKLPVTVESLQQQVARAYSQYKRYQTDLSRNIYLNNLRDRNETLFYCLLNRHVTEMMPMIYTPIVGTAVKEYSKEFRSPRGLYITYNDKDHIVELLRHRTHPCVDLIVATDGGGVLGIGDQGVGAMDIPIAKLMLYTLFGGIHPSRTLPIMLDVGTDNPELLNDPMYLGWRHPRIKGEQYYEFIATFIAAIQQEFPQAFLHWEDLGQREARAILQQYQHKICTFNDDIQGTGVVTLAAVLASCRGLGQRLSEQRIVVFGAGTAGMGITEELYKTLRRQGVAEAEARKCFWLLDRPGLLVESNPQLHPAQLPFARCDSECQAMQRNSAGEISLLEVIKAVKPTVLIGCSAVSGAFSEAVVKEMAVHCARPIIFPLSNPTERAEAHPSDLLRWTAGQAVIATGSPFMGVAFSERKHDIAQSNNALVFPGVGLGVVAAKAKHCSDAMLAAASEAIIAAAPMNQHPYGNCLPALADARQISSQIAVAVAEQARHEGIAMADDSLSVEQLVANQQWQPDYLPLRRVSSQ